VSDGGPDGQNLDNFARWPAAGAAGECLTLEPGLPWITTSTLAPVCAKRPSCRRGCVPAGAEVRLAVSRHLDMNELAHPPAGADQAAVADRTRVVVADDSVLLREGVARLLQDEGFEVVGRSGTAADLLLKVRSYEPDVALVDIRMPPTHTDEGIRAAKEIRAEHPHTAVLVLSQYAEPGYAIELLEDCADGIGYLLKDRINDLPEFTAAVRRVAAGGSALDSSVVSRLVGRRRRDDPLAELTPREHEVLELMAEGLSNIAIAERIVVTERAVEKHVTSIFQKLHLPAAGDTHRRVLAVLTFLRS
jgi:DNA-binding NarL/FixJ family response regulator